VSNIVIKKALRSPQGAFQGVFSSLSSVDLATQVLKKINLNDVDQLIVGCVLQAGLGQALARQIAIKSGLDEKTHCHTVNKVCGSGMLSVTQGFDQIKLGKANSVISVGTESMTNSPYILKKARSGYRMGHGQIIDHMMFDGLEDSFDFGKSMGFLAEQVAKEEEISRDSQEKYVLETYEFAKNFSTSSQFSKEVASIEFMQGKQNVVIDYDEPLQKVKPEKFKDLRPVFVENGSITVALSSSIADGASAILIEKNDGKNDDDCLAKIVDYSYYSTKPYQFTLAPVQSIKNLCEKIGWQIKDVDIWEINEAFATVPLLAIKHLKISRQILNINGGGCVLGHPIGCSGNRIVGSLAHSMKKHNLKKGIASICIGGGEAMAIALTRD
jgi:acetyl-CoA C-acetyltransferase